MADRKSLRLTPMGGDPLLGIVRTSIMRGTGMETGQLGKKPLIHTEMTTGHSRLASLGQKVKEGVIAAGGMAVEFNVPAPCDGVAMGAETRPVEKPALGYMQRYRKLVSSAARGAILE